MGVSQARAIVKFNIASSKEENRKCASQGGELYDVFSLICIIYYGINSPGLDKIYNTHLNCVLVRYRHLLDRYTERTGTYQLRSLGMVL